MRNFPNNSLLLRVLKFEGLSPAGDEETLHQVQWAGELGPVVLHEVHPALSSHELQLLNLQDENNEFNFTISYS